MDTTGCKSLECRSPISGPGCRERDTISEALRDEVDLVLMDERLGRNLAEYYGLRVVGTLGTLLKAKKIGIISEFLPIVRALQEHGFWYSENLVHRLANHVGE